VADKKLSPKTTTIRVKIIRLPCCDRFTMIFFFNSFLEPASNHPLIYQRFYRKGDEIS